MLRYNLIFGGDGTPYYTVKSSVTELAAARTANTPKRKLQKPASDSILTILQNETYQTASRTTIET